MHADPSYQDPTGTPCLLLGSNSFKQQRRKKGVLKESARGRVVSLHPRCCKKGGFSCADICLSHEQNFALTFNASTILGLTWAPLSNCSNASRSDWLHARPMGEQLIMPLRNSINVPRLTGSLISAISLKIMLVRSWYFSSPIFSIIDVSPILAPSCNEIMLIIQRKEGQWKKKQSLIHTLLLGAIE